MCCVAWTSETEAWEKMGGLMMEFVQMPESVEFNQNVSWPSPSQNATLTGPPTKMGLCNTHMFLAGHWPRHG